MTNVANADKRLTRGEGDTGRGAPVDDSARKLERAKGTQTKKRNPPKGAPPGAMSLLEFAQKCGVTRATIYNWLAKGRVPPSGWTSGGRPWWLPEDVEAFHASPFARRRAQQRKKTIENAMKRCARRLLAREPQD
jgi:predicted DNA-binding transcriptional regulator AlpA